MTKELPKQNNQGMQKYGSQRQLFMRNRKIILASQDICAICGKPVDKTLDANDPFAPEVDHIIPWSISHDCSLENLQLTHKRCNRLKSDKVVSQTKSDRSREIDNRDLPQTFDWIRY